MPAEELHLISDEKLLLTMSASANDARELVRRTLKIIERTRIMLRELDTREADGRRIS